MSWVAFIFMGAIAGWLAGRITRGKGFGLVTNIVVGILGALLGGWIFTLAEVSVRNGFFGGLIISLVGSIILLWLISLFKK